MGTSIVVVPQGIFLVGFLVVSLADGFELAHPAGGRDFAGVALAHGGYSKRHSVIARGKILIASLSRLLECDP